MEERYSSLANTANKQTPCQKCGLTRNQLRYYERKKFPFLIIKGKKFPVVF